MGGDDFLGFELINTKENGLNHVTRQIRATRPEDWAERVAIIAEILRRERPHTLFIPHELDLHPTHQGTHFLLLDALQNIGSELQCHIVETEFWGPMTDPNLMVESSPGEVADLVAATSFHVGEVRRNPYHVMLPAWMADNVRRGSELIGSPGAVAADFTFATLYRISVWDGQSLRTCPSGRRTVPTGGDIAALFSGLRE